mmetsp:Transcript_29370/g.57636  ORF Transcript_29370/g.57636 Transcript_29370/m.57636 type:complete len:293 (+) Transcript_29370:22-900(+)
MGPCVSSGVSSAPVGLSVENTTHVRSGRGQRKTGKVKSFEGSGSEQGEDRSLISPLPRLQPLQNKKPAKFAKKKKKRKRKKLPTIASDLDVTKLMSVGGRNSLAEGEANSDVHNKTEQSADKLGRRKGNKRKSTKRVQTEADDATSNPFLAYSEHVLQNLNAKQRDAVWNFYCSNLELSGEALDMMARDLVQRRIKQYSDHLKAEQPDISKPQLRKLVNRKVKKLFASEEAVGLSGSIDTYVPAMVSKIQQFLGTDRGVNRVVSRLVFERKFTRFCEDLFVPFSQDLKCVVM